MENSEDKYSRDTQKIAFRKIMESRAEGPDTTLEAVVPVPAHWAGRSAEEEAAAPEANHQWSDDEAAPDQDEITTPVPLAVPREEARAEPGPRRSSWVLWAVVVLSLVIGILSLALNVVLIYNLMSARQTAVEGLDAAIAALDNFGGNGFHYEYRFNETIPFSGDIPIKQDLVFPFQGNIPINTTVRVPIDAGVLGQFTIDVPINTSFYVDIEVPVSVDQTVHVETEVPLDMVIPIDIQPDDPLIQNLIEQVRAWLVRLKGSF